MQGLSLAAKTFLTSWGSKREGFLRFKDCLSNSLIHSPFISLKPGITALTSEDIICEYSLIKDWRRGLLSFDERINREIKTAGEMLFLASGFRWRRFWHPLGKFAVSAGDQLCNNQLQSFVNFLYPLLAMWANDNWPPSMKVKKIKIFLNKMGLKGCKWSSLNAPGPQTHLSHPILELGEFPFPINSPLG